MLVGGRQEQVPQSLRPRLELELLDDRRGAPRVGRLGDLVAEALLRRVDELVHEREQAFAQLDRRAIEREVHPLAVLPDRVALLEECLDAFLFIFTREAESKQIDLVLQSFAQIHSRRAFHRFFRHAKRYRALLGDLLRLVEHARQVDRITCKTPYGTEFQAELSPKLKWLKTSGIITRDKWGNLPGGEIFTAPMNTNGVFVVDGVVGDYLCERFGDLQSNPLTIEVEDNRIRALRSENKDLRDEFRAYTNTDENSNRVGEFAIGTNIACTHIIGHILQDEKIPGVHIAFGHPYAEHTGANWVSKTHIDCVGRDFDIWFDGQQVMQGGKFLI